MRKRLRKKLERRPRLIPGVYVTFSQSLFVTMPGPEHPGKKGSAKARYRYRRWARRAGIPTLWSTPPRPFEPARRISSQEEFNAVFGPLER